MFILEQSPINFSFFFLFRLRAMDLVETLVSSTSHTVSYRMYSKTLVHLVSALHKCVVDDVKSFIPVIKRIVSFLREVNKKKSVQKRVPEDPADVLTALEAVADGLKKCKKKFRL